MQELSNFYVSFLSNPFNAGVFIFFCLAIMAFAIAKTSSDMFRMWSVFTFAGSILYVALINVDSDRPEIIYGPLVIIENSEQVTP